MKTRESRKELILIGKFSEVSEYLRECGKKYTYVHELMEALSSERCSKYLN